MTSAKNYARSSVRKDREREREREIEGNKENERNAGQNDLAALFVRESREATFREKKGIKQCFTDTRRAMKTAG